MNLRIDVYHHVTVEPDGTVANLLRELKELAVTNQQKIDAVAAAIDAATAGIRADIQALKDAVAKGETLDFTALEAKVEALSALDADNPPPAPPTP